MGWECNGERPRVGGGGVEGEMMMQGKFGIMD
jgi:hypothetical protein